MPRLSPDGRYVVYQWDGRRTEADAVNWDIYVQPVESTEPSRLTTDPTSEFGAAWSPDGERVVFLHTVEPGRYTIREISKLGGTPKTISPPDVFAVGDGIDWSPDGESIVFTTSPDSSGQRGLALLSYHTGGVTPLTRPPAGTDDRSLATIFARRPDGGVLSNRRGCHRRCRRRLVRGYLYSCYRRRT